MKWQTKTEIEVIFRVVEISRRENWVVIEFEQSGKRQKCFLNQKVAGMFNVFAQSEWPPS